MPLNGLYDVDGGLKQIGDACRARGRDPQSVSLGIFFAAPPDPEVVKKISDLGAKRAILPLPPAGRDVVLPILDRYTNLIK